MRLSAWAKGSLVAVAAVVVSVGEMVSDSTSHVLAGTASSTTQSARSVKQVHATTVTDTVQWNVLRQSIVGFGGSGAFQMANNLKMMSNQERSHILSLLFSTKNGIGLTVVRSLINDGTNGWTIEPSPGKWNWDILPDDQIWLMRVAKKYGANVMMATPWSPPAWMKEDNSVGGGDGVQNNVLKPADYHAYAEYLANYVNGYWTHFRIRINVLSIQNEPNWNASYASCIWTPEQLHTFIRDDLIPVFKQKHVQTQLMMPEELDWSEDYALPTLEDPTTAKAVSIVAAHGYSGTVAPLPVAESEHKQVWESEDSTLQGNDPSIRDGLKWATTINQYLTVANVNEWNYWWLVDTQADGGGLVYLQPPYQYTLTKRLYTLGNYSRFVRPGFVRLQANNNPSPGIYLSAFRDPKTGHFAVVVVNNNTTASTLSVQVAGVTGGPGSVVPYVTSAKENLKRGLSIVMSNGIFKASLEAESVTTFVGE